MTILTPYRNRSEHLAKFIPHMKSYLPACEIVVIEQDDERPFNRGALLNCGYREFSPDYFALHDIDKLPVSANYSEPVESPRQLADNKFQTMSYFGGVTLFSGKTFELIGGFRNDFWGWGGEDNELLARLHKYNIRPVYDFGVFDELPHPRPASEFNMYRWRESQKPRPPRVSMFDLKYVVTDRKVYDDYTHLKVKF